MLWRLVICVFFPNCLYLSPHKCRVWYDNCFRWYFFFINYNNLLSEETLMICRCVHAQTTLGKQWSISDAIMNGTGSNLATQKHCDRDRLVENYMLNYIPSAHPWAMLRSLLLSHQLMETICHENHNCISSISPLLNSFWRIFSHPLNHTIKHYKSYQFKITMPILLHPAPSSPSP